MSASVGSVVNRIILRDRVSLYWKFGAALADKSQKAKKSQWSESTQKRRTTPLLYGASGVGLFWGYRGTILKPLPHKKELLF